MRRTSSLATSLERYRLMKTLADELDAVAPGCARVDSTYGSDNICIELDIEKLRAPRE